MSFLKSFMILLCLMAFSISPAIAQPNPSFTEITVHVDRAITRTLVRITIAGQSPVELRRFRQNQFYNSYRHRIEWPIGSRVRRNDFELIAMVKTDQSTARPNRFYLRLRPGPPHVELYVFHFEASECQWRNLETPITPEQIFQQLSVAEAMLRIETRRGRCAPQYLRRWTEIWIDRINRLWRRHNYVSLDPDVIGAIQRAHALPRGLFRRTMPLPDGFARIVALDREFSSKFN